MNIISFAFVDTAMASATLTLKYGKNFEPDARAPGLRSIVLRGPQDGDWSLDQPQSDSEILESWPSAQTLLQSTYGKLHEHMGGQNLQLGRAVIEEIAPNAFLGWQANTSAYDKAHSRFRLLLLPAAGFTLYSDNNMLAPGVGNLTFFDQTALHSVVNFGPVPAVSLVVDVRKPPVQ